MYLSSGMVWFIKERKKATEHEPFITIKRFDSTLKKHKFAIRYIDKHIQILLFLTNHCLTSIQNQSSTNNQPLLFTTTLPTITMICLSMHMNFHNGQTFLFCKLSPVNFENIFKPPACNLSECNSF